MKDRIPMYPGRVKLVPVSGQSNTYDMTRADQPTQVGTPINKSTLLTDATATAIGLTGDPTVDDALAKLNGNIITPILNVHTSAGVTVTATKGSKVLTATANSSGLAVLYPNELGTWVLSATISGKAMSVNYEIDTVSVRDIYLTTDLASASWEVISAISEAGLASSYWKVGDKKTITVEGENYEVQIIGFNHDTKTSGGKAGITFQMVNCLKATSTMTTGSSSSVVSWVSTVARQKLQTIYNGLSHDLKAAIKPVNKLTFQTKPGTISTYQVYSTVESLFLLAEVEIYGATTYSSEGEGSEYSWYSAGNRVFKSVPDDTTFVRWWLRSRNKSVSNSSYCCYVGTSMSALKGSEQGTNNNYISFAFCV